MGSGSHWQCISDEFVGAVDGVYQSWHRFGIKTAPVSIVVRGHIFVDPSIESSKFSPNSDEIRWCFSCSTLSDMKILRYSALVLALLDTIDLKGENILDLGCADGALSLFALKLGAARAYSVDKSESWKSRIREHMRDNDISLDSNQFLCADVRDHKRLRYNIPLGDISLVVANIGPHYGNSDLGAIRLIEHLPRAKYFVGGGYTSESGGYSPDRALELLKEFCFIHPRIVKYKREHRSPKLAFIVERNSNE